MQKTAIYQIDPSTNDVVDEFPSIRAAGRSVGVNKETLRLILNHPDKLCRGFRWITQDYCNKLPEQEYKGAKILVLDIETAPLEAYVWGLWKQNIYSEQLISNWYMLTWAAKWLYSDRIMSDVLTPTEAITENDYRIICSLWKLIDEADIVIAHNGDKFDIARMKSRFIVYEMKPPSFYKQLDTLKVARKEFGFLSNSLNALAKIFNVPCKYNTSFSLWKGAKQGVQEDLDAMELYNRQDIKVLEDVYLRMRPYIKGHPNLDLYVDDEKSSCPHCSSKKLIVEEGKFAYTQALRYPMYRCTNCGAIARARKGLKYQFKKQISSIPR